MKLFTVVTLFLALALPSLSQAKDEKISIKD